MVNPLKNRHCLLITGQTIVPQWDSDLKLFEIAKHDNPDLTEEDWDDAWEEGNISDFAEPINDYMGQDIESIVQWIDCSFSNREALKQLLLEMDLNSINHMRKN